MISASGTNLNQCQHCGNYHTGQCPRVKAIEYHDNGAVKRIEFFEPTQVYSGLWQVGPALNLPYKITCNSAAETMLLSEPVLRREWGTPDEDEAWKHLDISK